MTSSRSQRPSEGRPPGLGALTHPAPPLAALTVTLTIILTVPAPLAAARVELRLRQPDGRPLAGAVLYALALDARKLPPPAPAVMDQRDRRFVPQILPVQTGAVVSFPNTDSILHHVYSFSPPKRFELYLPKPSRGSASGARGNRSSQVTFDRAGVVALGCNIHDWMLAYILVIDTPWFAKTDEQGVAVLDDLPAGHYRLVAWHPRITDAESALEREGRLGSDGTESWAVDLHSPLLPSRDQEPGFREY